MDKLQQKAQRQVRTRRKLRLNKDRVRLSVYRSNQYVYAQIIDDASGKTLVSVSEKQLAASKASRMEKAKSVGMEIPLSLSAFQLS